MFQQKILHYNNLKKEINDLELELHKYNEELLLFHNNDDYKYNPLCQYCCKRPWVNRIKELEIIIKKLNDDINIKKLDYDHNDYELLNKHIENNNTIIINYDLLIQWLNYYKYKEEYDIVCSELNTIIINKETCNKNIISIKEQLKHIIYSIDCFNNFCFHIHDKIIYIDLYIKYKSWEDDYNTECLNINNLNKAIDDLEFKLNYNKNIKPRINKYKVLKNNYDKWSDYDFKLKIIRTNELFELKKLIDLYDNYNEYVNNNNLKPLIKQKFELNDLIKDKDKHIKTINDDLIKCSTLNAYYKDNKDNYDKLFHISNQLNDTIELLDTIIINFQSFRIELYENHILNNLISNTNSIIKKLCHFDTKPFKLGFYLNVSKDIIHINWLINNDIDSDNKIISVSHASGFQHFTISLALRMCLFLNKNNLYCNQLFIDEGFVSFDKFNLSIVPNFLKNLLSYFNSILLVSHIDLIQDNVDDFIDIYFNKREGCSSILYGLIKNVKRCKTRRKKIASV